ncbi:uncharacterized protein LOC34617376 [Cyclospora cayetanensis]|uniref:Uncharacterized protein LOC34617376 n=1 Tax=Cyclospora cayetanensis TaxID=88456 RepID=A0A6P6RYY7_9EIME|nr:uncharacterized protein LOC34617376 [Cyclospora cayetanensis]
MGLLQQHEGSSPSSAAASPCQQQPKDEAEECQHQRQAVYRVRLPRALLFKPVLSHTPEEAPPSAEKDFELSLEEAAASAVESWIDPDGSDFAAAAQGEIAWVLSCLLFHAFPVFVACLCDNAAVLPLLAYRVAALFAFFDAKSKDPLAVGTLGRTLSCLLRSLAFVLGRLLKGPLGRRRLKLSVAAAAENATVVATPPPDAAAEAPAAAQLPASHVLYQHHSFNLYAEFCLCMRGNPQSVEAPLPASGSFDILPLPAVAGVTFPLVVSAKKRWSLEKGAPKTSSSGASAERASLDAVDVREDEVVFLGEGLRFRILECIRILVRAASGRDGYMALVESVTRSEVPIHLKAVCLPGLLAATAKIRRKKDRFITQLCSIIMNKTLPVRAPHSATESLAKLLPSTAKRVLRIKEKQQVQQQQVQQQQVQQQQQEPGVKGSFPVLAVGSDVSLPLRLLILAHATQGLVVALDAGSGASNGLDKKTESFGQEELEQEREAQKKGSGEADPQTEQHADNPLVAMHAIQSVLFKALELSVPLLADPFMAPPTPEGSACVQIDRSRLHSMQREPWSGACQALAECAVRSRAGLVTAQQQHQQQHQYQYYSQQQQRQWTAEELSLWFAVDSLVRQSGALLSRGEETLCYALQRLNICAAPAPQQGDMEVGPLASACLVYGLLILLLGSPSLPAPICLAQRAVWALKAACIFMQHADAEAAATAAAGTARQQQQQQQQQKEHLAAAAESVGIWKEARWLLQRKAEQLLVFGVSLLPIVQQQHPERFETPHSLRAYPALLLLLLLQQMASASTSAARGFLILSQMGGRLHAAAEEQDGCLSSLGIADVEDGPVEASFLKEKLKAEHFALRGGDMTVLYRCVAVLTGVFAWKAQISLFQSLLNPKEFQLPDAATAAVLILLKERWCLQVLHYQNADAPAAAAADANPQVSQPAGAVGGAKDPLLALTNLNVLAFVVQTQLINREETIAEGSERLSCVLNWLKLVLLQGHKNPNRGPNKAHGSNPFYAMGLLLLRSLKQPLLEALRRLASQADAEEVLTQSRGGPEGLRGPQCLLGRGAPSTADKVELLRPCGGAMRHSSAAAEQRMRLQLVCLVLQEVRDLVYQAADAAKGTEYFFRKAVVICHFRVTGLGQEGKEDGNDAHCCDLDLHSARPHGLASSNLQLNIHGVRICSV